MSAMNYNWEKELVARMQKIYLLKKQDGTVFPEHDLSHALRVKNLCLWIVKREHLHLDKEILVASALLHDIGYTLDDSPEHTEASAQLANMWLSKVRFQKNKITSVVVCIKNHDTVPGRLGWKEEVPIECKVLRDADSIESFGCLGVIRFAMWSGRNKTPIYNQKLNDNKNGVFPNINLIKNIEIRTAELMTRCYTETAKRLLEQRLKNMQMFVSEIKKEINFAENLGGK